MFVCLVKCAMSHISNKQTDYSSLQSCTESSAVTGYLHLLSVWLGGLEQGQQADNLTWMCEIWLQNERQ